MKLLRFLRFALIGWIAGTLFTLSVGLIWPAIFPGIVRSESTNDVPLIGLPTSILITLLMTALPALIGGMVGGVLPREGGSREEWVAAAIGGIVLCLPFACFNFWLLSGT